VRRLLLRPRIRLSGEVGEEMLKSFREQFDAAAAEEGPLAVELSTSGGDADVGLRIAEDLRLARERLGREVWFMGKGAVYSAGVLIMAGVPCDRRWVSRHTTLLIHGRRMSQTVVLDAPLDTCLRRLEELVSETENGLRLESEGYARLVEGCRITLEELKARARTAWYVSAEEAVELGLVAGVL
jgi:ATP-dependent protease ClpP protease subunit